MSLLSLNSIKSCVYASVKVGSVWATNSIRTKMVPSYGTIKWKLRPPHTPRARVLELIKPIFPREEDLFEADTCENTKPIDDFSLHEIYCNLRADEHRQKLLKAKIILFCHANPVKGEEWRKLKFEFRRLGLLSIKESDLHIISKALEDTPYEAAKKLTEASITIFYGDDVDTLMKCWTPLMKSSKLVLIAGILHNRMLSFEELDAYRKMPDKTTLLAQTCATLESAPASLVQDLSFHQTMLSDALEQLCKNDKQS